jgi:3',5'-cyclic AMP phosphodiesterase CpdA
MKNSMDEGPLVWAHLGDLHITGADQPNYRDFLAIIETLNSRLAKHLDFCVLPGDNADDGAPDQYALIARGLERLSIPMHVIPGDHDRKPGDLHAFYQGLGLPPVPYAVTVKGCRCLFLDVVSPGGGGPDFALGQAQLGWLGAELESAVALRQKSVVFMHAYPADLRRDGERVATPGFRPPDRAADGSDADAIDAWPERHLLGTRLGPNRNGKQW